MAYIKADITKLLVGDPVLYIPSRIADDDTDNPACEHGEVSTIRDDSVWVKYSRSGILGTTGQKTPITRLFIHQP